MRKSRPVCRRLTDQIQCQIVPVAAEVVHEKSDADVDLELDLGLDRRCRCATAEDGFLRPEWEPVGIHPDA